MGVKTPTNVSPKSGEMPGFLIFFFLIQQFLAIVWFHLSLLDYIMGFLPNANRQSQALCALVLGVDLSSLELKLSIMCSGKGRKSILANITSGTLGIKGIFYSVMSPSVSSLKPSASDDETVPRPNNTNNN